MIKLKIMFEKLKKLLFEEDEDEEDAFALGLFLCYIFQS